VTLCGMYFMPYYVALICKQTIFYRLDAEMSARRKTVPVTTGIQRPRFRITKWPEIVRACKFKSKLRKAARAEIEVATRHFLWLEGMEAKAIPSAKKKNELFAVADAAKRLRTKLAPLKAAAVTVTTEETIQNFDSGFQSLHRLSRYFEGTDTFRAIKLSERKRFPDFVQEMKLLDDILASLELAANKAAKAMDLEVAPQLKGDAWNHWIAKVYKIVTDAGLSATTSNDTNKRANTETPFMRLVRELQKLLPSEARRPDDKDQALAKAIQRATEHYRPRRQGAISRAAA
jgi:hypothetical protein